MDINQKRLKSLANQTDLAFEQYKQHPTSEDYAQAYEEAKSALDHHITEIRVSMQQKVKKS